MHLQIYKRVFDFFFFLIVSNESTNTFVIQIEQKNKRVLVAKSDIKSTTQYFFEIVFFSFMFDFIFFVRIHEFLKIDGNFQYSTY